MKERSLYQIMCSLTDLMKSIGLALSVLCARAADQKAPHSFQVLVSFEEPNESYDGISKPNESFQNLLGS